eukprot:752824-Hanusia_phi.AAC.3
MSIFVSSQGGLYSSDRPAPQAADTSEPEASSGGTRRAKVSEQEKKEPTKEIRTCDFTTDAAALTRAAEYTQVPCPLPASTRTRVVVADKKVHVMGERWLWLACALIRDAGSVDSIQHAKNVISDLVLGRPTARANRKLSAIATRYKREL